MQMKHCKLKVFFGLFLAAGVIDIYFIHTSVIPLLFADDGPAASVPVRKEQPPQVAPRIAKQPPVTVTIPNDSSAVEPPSSVEQETDSVMAVTDTDTVIRQALPAPEAQGASPAPTAEISEASQAAQTAEDKDGAGGDGVATETPTPETRAARTDLPKATAKQLPGLEPLRFGPNRTLLWKFEKKMLRSVAKTLLHYGNVGVRLVGHADNQEKKTDELSMARALKAKTFLEAEGVPSGLIEVESAGAKKPATKGTFAEDRKKNRRVRVRLFIKDTM